jgi:hypothetical protein
LIHKFDKGGIDTLGHHYLSILVYRLAKCLNVNQEYRWY